MTSIPLSIDTIQAYAGRASRHEPCEEISKIHLEYDIDSNVVIEARIPARAFTQSYFVISPDGSSILESRCTCPAATMDAKRCEHIHKVLCRIADSPSQPISGPGQAHLSLAARRNRLAQQMENASVYVAFTCKSEEDSFSDYRRSWLLKDNFDQEVIGVFFSKKRVIQCDRDYVQHELGHDIGEEDDDGSDDHMSDDNDDDDSFVFDGSMHDYEGQSFHKVWIERRAIEDASPNFHK